MRKKKKYILSWNKISNQRPSHFLFSKSTPPTQSLLLSQTLCLTKTAKINLEMRGIDPRTSRMLSERSTI